ncbi:50S ribosomal protein L1 [Candidatus Dependentiae bacterium]|nr:50S ribosomal protein L1 [Candidatus Dependentiae bacterium]
MKNHGKKYLQAREKLPAGKVFSHLDGLKKLKELSFARFDESVDVHVNLGIDPSKGDQVVRGSVLLPHGIGRQVKVVVFAKGDYAEAARKAGADYVGAEDLIEKIEGGWLDFNNAVATPDLMGLVGKVAKILGPRGLVPNKKTGTVTFDVADVVSDLKKGRLFFKNDKSGIIHFSFGRVSFDVEKLDENLDAFIRILVGSKPSSSKGKFIKKLTISSTMGLGVPLNPDEIS